MEIIILAGGFGTRLRHVVSDVPKPMAPINNKPFLSYVLTYLKAFNVERVVMAIGYKAEQIISYFGDRYMGIEIAYSVEDEPLGTGGAVKQALEHCTQDQIVLLNGDTFFNVDLEDLMRQHRDRDGDITVAAKHMQNFERYGALSLEDGRISKFHAPKAVAEGYINGGVYVINRTLLQAVEQKVFSFEKLVLSELDIEKFAYPSEGYFIDIGIPEDYNTAQRDFEQIFEVANGIRL